MEERPTDVPYLVRLDVADLPAWEVGEVDELDLENWQAGDVDWRLVAEVSLAALDAGFDSDDGDVWEAFGRDAGLADCSLLAFISLHGTPICVSTDGWINGRHRAYAMQRAGAKAFASENLEYVPPFVRDPA